MNVSILIDHYNPCRWRTNIPAIGGRIPPRVVGLARYLDAEAAGRPVLATPAKVISTLRDLLVADRARDWELRTHDAGMIGLRIGDRSWGILLYEPARNPRGIPVCRVCGCTEQLGCRGGCYWVYGALCSSCRSLAPLLAGGVDRGEC